MKKNKSNQQDKPEDAEKETSKHEDKKRSLAAKLLRGMSYFFLFLFLLVIGTGVALEYYFPAEEIRALAEKEGSKQLQLPLSIKKIKLSLLSGVRVDGVVLGPVSKPIASVQTVAFDYDLSQLLQGHLVINQILVDQPQLNAISKNGVWNFQPLLNLKDNKKSPPPSSGSSAPLPLARIDLQQLSIRKAGAMLLMDDQLTAYLKGLDLEAKGKASLKEIDLKLRVLMNPDPNFNIFFKQQKNHFQSIVTTDLNFAAKDLKKVNISGNFNFKQNQIQIGDVLPSPNLGGSLTAEVQLQPEQINLSSLLLTLDDKNKILLSTQAKNFSTSPEIKTHIKKVSFQLADILKWGANWLPPISGHGTLETENLEIQAKLPGFKPENITLKGGTLATKDLTLDSKELKIHIENMNSSLHLNEVSLINGKPRKVTADLKMQLAKARAQEAEIQNWKQALTLTAEGPDLSQLKMSFNTDIDSLHYNHPLSKKVILPFHAEGSLDGNWKKGDLKLQNVSYHSGKLIKGTLSGEMKQKKSFLIQKDLTIDIQETLKILPKEISEKIPAMEASGKTHTSFSFKGELDSKFLPTNINGSTKIHLKNISSKLNKPRLQVEGFNTSIQFPLNYQSEKGIKIPTLKIHSTLKKVDALNNWKLADFSFESKLKNDSFYNLKPDFGTLPIKLDSHIKFGRLHSTEPELSLTEFITDAHLKGDLRPDDFRNSQLEGNVSLQNISALEKFRVGKVASQFSLQVHDKSLSRIRFSQKTKITSINDKERKFNLKEMSIESLSRTNLPAGNFDLDKFLFKATDLVDVQLKGNAKNWGESFALESTLDHLNLASIWKQIPADMKKSLDLKGLGGQVEISLKTKGRLPSSNDKNLKPLEKWTETFVSLNPNHLPPLEVSSRIQLQNGKVSHLDKNVQGLSLVTMLAFKNGSAELSGKASGKLQGMEIFEKLPLLPEFNFQYHLENLNTLSITKHQLDLKNRGVSHTLEGKVDGLKIFLNDPLDPSKILNNINIALKNENSLKIEEAMKDEIFGDIKATGELSSQINIHQKARDSINLAGNIGFNRFSAEIPTVAALNNLTGSFPFSKSLSLSSDLNSRNSTPPTQKSFFKQLRDFSRYKNNIKADSLETSGQTIENIGMDMMFKNNRLAVDKFIFDVLGGTVGGHFSFTQTSKGPTLKFVTEFAKIDSSRLLSSEQEKNIDSKIDGNMEMAFQVETANISLDNLFLKIAITKIGTKTLDRLLLFIDPEESKPAIVDTRAKLKLAAPHRVLISLENGNLNMEAWLKSDLLGIIKAPELKRIPVAGLKQFSTINKQLKSLQEPLKILNIIAANRIVFENEEFIFKH